MWGIMSDTEDTDGGLVRGLESDYASSEEDVERDTLLHSHVNPTGLSLWVFCLIILIVTETEPEQ